MGARRLLTAALAAALWPAGAGAAADCPELAGAVGRAARDGYGLAYRFDPAGPPTGAPFAVEIALCGPDGPVEGDLAVDADMPAHRHGMNYRPETRRTGPGRYRAEGLLFHMAGDWRLRFVVRRDGAPPVRLDAAVTAP